MGTQCIDISDNKRMGTTSPIAMFAFMFIFVILTVLMDPDLIYWVCLGLALVFTQIFFQYKPRYIFLSIKFLLKNAYLTPSFEDKKYIYDETQISEIAAVMHPSDVQKRRNANKGFLHSPPSKKKNETQRGNQ